MHLTDKLALAKDQEEFDRILAEESFDQEECRSVPEPAPLVTIKEIGQENISKEGAEPNLKWILYFHEVDKGLVLNSTNGQIIAKIAGSDESDDWADVQIVLIAP